MPDRVDRPEYQDLGVGSEREVAENLAEIARLNRYLGGVRALASHLYPRLARAQGPVTLLDLGTGGADIPLHLARWAASHGVPLRVLALDRAWGHLSVAADRLDGVTIDSGSTGPRIRLVCADALGLPFSPGSVDYVVSSLLLHHLAPEEVVALLRDCFERAARGIVMSDLVRGWLPYYAFKLVQPLLARNRLTRHDGALSVRRAYTPAELRALARAAELPGARVHAHPFWRQTLVALK